MRELSKKLLFISAFKNDYNYSKNYARTTTLKYILDDLNLPYNYSKGFYKNKDGIIEKELSFIVQVQDDSMLETLMKICFNNFNQESVLFRDHDRTASLLYQDGTTENLGFLREVDEKDVLNGVYDSFTYDKNSKRFFSTF